MSGFCIDIQDAHEIIKCINAIEKKGTGPISDEIQQLRMFASTQSKSRNSLQTFVRKNVMKCSQSMKRITDWALSSISCV